MNDKRTADLTRAADIWQEAAHSTPEERLKHIAELRDMKLFSNRQISKICRVGTRAVNDAGPKTSVGGRLNPASLSGMVILRELYIGAQTLPLPIVRAIVNEGTSLSNLCRLVGMPNVALYRKLKGEK